MKDFRVDINGLTVNVCDLKTNMVIDTFTFENKMMHHRRKRQEFLSEKGVFTVSVSRQVGKESVQLCVVRVNNVLCRAFMEVIAVEMQQAQDHVTTIDKIVGALQERSAKIREVGRLKKRQAYDIYADCEFKDDNMAIFTLAMGCADRDGLIVREDMADGMVELFKTMSAKRSKTDP